MAPPFSSAAFKASLVTLGLDHVQEDSLYPTKRNPLIREPRSARFPPVYIAHAPLRRHVSFADSVPGLTLTCIKLFDTRDPPQLCNKDLTIQQCESLRKSASLPDFSLHSTHNMFLPKPVFVITREPRPTTHLIGGTLRLVHFRYDPYKNCMFGSISVVNHAFEKKVWVRFTVDGWNTYNDVSAGYSWTRHGYIGPSTDYFSIMFAIDSAFLVPGIQFEFVVGCMMGGVMHWDNNDGKNYAAEVKSASLKK